MFHHEEDTYLYRVVGADAALDDSSFSLVHEPGIRGSLRHLMLDAACQSVIGTASPTQVRRQVDSYPSSHSKMGLPQMIYNLEHSPIPQIFTDGSSGYAKMIPEERSQLMQGNVRLAAEMVRWSSARRMRAFPSLVNSDQLAKLLFSELGELRELNGVSHDHEGFSLLRRAIDQRDNEVGLQWYERDDAMRAWDVTGELADIAFCSLQHWFVYDSFTVEECVNQASRVMQRFDQVNDRIDDSEKLIQLVEQYSHPDHFANDIPVFDQGIGAVWPEFYFGLAYLLSKKVGIDIWEAITLKSFANERHYPTQLRLEEMPVEDDIAVEGMPPAARLMDDPIRPPAWVFAKNIRKMVSPAKRFIAPMSDPFARETVLDLIFASPYLDSATRFSLVDLVREAGEQARPYIIPALIAVADLDPERYSQDYYVR